MARTKGGKKDALKSISTNRFKGEEITLCVHAGKFNVGEVFHAGETLEETAKKLRRMSKRILEKSGTG